MVGTGMLPRGEGLLITSLNGSTTHTCPPPLSLSLSAFDVRKLNNAVMRSSPHADTRAASQLYILLYPSVAAATRGSLSLSPF